MIASSCNSIKCRDGIELFINLWENKNSFVVTWTRCSLIALTRAPSEDMVDMVWPSLIRIRFIIFVLGGLQQCLWIRWEFPDDSQKVLRCNARVLLSKRAPLGCPFAHRRWLIQDVDRTNMSNLSSVGVRERGRVDVLFFTWKCLICLSIFARPNPSLVAQIGLRPRRDVASSVILLCSQQVNCAPICWQEASRDTNPWSVFFLQQLNQGEEFKCLLKCSPIYGRDRKFLIARPEKCYRMSLFVTSQWHHVAAAKTKEKWGGKLTESESEEHGWSKRDLNLYRFLPAVLYFILGGGWIDRWKARNSSWLFYADHSGRSGDKCIDRVSEWW